MDGIVGHYVFRDEAVKWHVQQVEGQNSPTWPWRQVRMLNMPLGLGPEQTDALASSGQRQSRTIECQHTRFQRLPDVQWLSDDAGLPFHPGTGLNGVLILQVCRVLHEEQQRISKARHLPKGKGYTLASELCNFADIQHIMGSVASAARTPGGQTDGSCQAMP